MTDAVLPDRRGQLLPTELLARLLTVTPDWVRKLAARGVLVVADRDHRGNLYELAPNVAAFVRHLRDENRNATKTAAETRMRDAKSREIELRIAEREGRLMETAEALGIVDDIVGMYRSEFSGLPARVTRDLQFRRTIETAVNDILDRVADLAAAKAGSHAAGA